MKLKVPRALIKYYVDYAVSDYLDEYQDAPSDLSELDKFMPNLKATLMANHEQLSFAFGLQKILNNPEEDLQKYYSYNFPLENEEIRSIMNYLLCVVLPDTLIAKDTAVITEESIESDRIERGLLYKVDAGESLKVIADRFGLTMDYIKEANPYWNRLFGDSSPIEIDRAVRLKLADDWH